jgi:hypothetical protein
MKKIRQEINKAEKTTTVFDLNLGQVPIIDKDTLSGKVTRAINPATASSDEIKKGNYTAAEAEEILDDVLSCASLDFLGNGGSKKFYNKAKPHDPRNGTFCTVPTKLTFRTKDERIKAEQTLRKFCKVKCSVPYPKKLRTIIGDIVKKGKQVKHNNYIRVKVDNESLTDSIDRDSINLLDATVPGFRINPNNVARMASDIRDLVKGTDTKNTVIVIQVLDNSTYYCGKDFGEMSLPKKGKDNRYHVDGELKYVKKQLLRELFTQILELVKAAGDCQVVITLPLSRWLLYRCCGDPSHCTNRGEDSFSANM